MLRKNTKLFLSRRFVGCNMDFNMTPSSIIGEMLAQYFQLEIQNSTNPDFSKVLYISDLCHPDNTVMIHQEHFQDTEVATEAERLSFPIHIDSLHYGIFSQSEDYQMSLRSKYSVIIIGPINTIPEEIFDSICTLFADKLVIFFGDSLVSANEYQNYHLRYLSNATYSLRYEYDDRRISRIKKINSVLYKLRKEKTQIEDLSTSQHVTLGYQDTIDTGNILHYFQEHPQNTVIVPRRCFAHTMSACYISEYGDALDMTEGLTYYLKDPWLYQDEQGNPAILPAMSPIQIGNVQGEYFHPETGRHYITATMLLETGKQDKPFLILPDCAIDMTSYVSQFVMQEHPSNYEEFQIAERLFYMTEEPDYTVLHLTPFRLVVGEEAKRFLSHATLCYMESLERDLHYRSDRAWFKYFVRTKERIDIIHCDEFQL